MKFWRRSSSCGHMFLLDNDQFWLWELGFSALIYLHIIYVMLLSATYCCEYLESV